MFKYLILISINLLILTGLSSSAAAAEAELGEVVVTASRIDERAFDAKADVRVITAEDIEENRFADLAEALSSLNGVTVDTYGNGVGYENMQTLEINGSSQIVVVIDGIRANTSTSMFNVFNFQSMPNLDSIERIEVLNGSASTLYGADAKGGVVNIITKAPEKNVFKFGAENGTFGFQDYRLYAAGGGGDLSWRLSANKRRSSDYKDGNGNRYISDGDAENISAKFWKKTSGRSTLSLAFDNYESDTVHTGTYFRQQHGMRPPASFYEKQQRLILAYRTQFSEESDNLLSLYRIRSTFNGQNFSTTEDMIDGKADTTTWGFSDHYRLKWHEKHRLAAGVEYSHETIDDWADLFFTYSDESYYHYSLYAEDNWDFDGRYSLTLGARYYRHSIAGGRLSPSVTLGLAADEKTNLYLSAKDYFVPPSQYQLFSGYGNKDLSPESGQTYEFGVKHAPDNDTIIDANLFYRRGKNTISYNKEIKKYENLDREKVWGFRANVTRQLDEHFKATLGYAWIRYKNVDAEGEESYSSNYPNGEIKVGLNYKNRDLTVVLFGRGVMGRKGSRQYASRTNLFYGTYPVSSFWVVDMTVNYKTSEHLTFYLKINNIFDEFYCDDVTGVYGHEDIYGAPGRNFRVGFTYEF
ncbi:TonB-dependent receptor domain-containing protein [uncultured Cloacibacillus sp.]|uniref:TonB-dependent receptor plug domain-containing protein n=1 Tax=uncultured Cloacibacillus sp. TaxID=889794 RepID=UPI0027D98F56|nr:TonB-dependent receptor [uncultured Cloacibacillus sp.]